MTKEERDSIVNEAVEKALLKVPEIIGNLMMTYSNKAKASKEFYDKYPQFNKHRDIVAATIEKVEDEDFTKTFEEILDAAVPKIKQSIKNFNGLDMGTVRKPKLDYNGEI